jgi:hypothetical protein
VAALLAVDLREFYLRIPFFFMWFLDLPCFDIVPFDIPALPRCCPWSRRRRPAAARGSCLSPLYLVGCFRFEVLSSASAPKLPPQCCDGRRSASDQNASSHDCVLRVDMRQDNAGFSAMFLSRPGTRGRGCARGGILAQADTASTMSRRNFLAAAATQRDAIPRCISRDQFRGCFDGR